MRVVFSNGGNGDVTWVANGSGWQNASYITTVTSDWSQMYVITEYGLTINVDDTINFKNIQVIDLTQMFGLTIADAIYAMEQTNTGSGVAWFKKYFPKLYYEYNAGSLQSVNVASHDMVGFNAWDEEWESGSISTSTGANTSSTSAFRSKNYIPCLPNTAYSCTVKSTIQTYYYDANKNFISFQPLANLSGTPVVFNTPVNCYCSTCWNT